MLLPEGGTGERLGDGGPEADEPGFSEEELTALALAADPAAPLSEDAVPFALFLGQLPLVLPQWYMPPAISSTSSCFASTATVPIAVICIAAFRVKFASTSPRKNCTLPQSTEVKASLVVVLAFVMIDAWGLCSTYGSVTLA